MRVRSLVTFAIPFLVCSSSSYAAFTSINTFGNEDGSERCLVGVPVTPTQDNCTKGGAYLNQLSITQIYANDSGRTLSRLDDATDKVWTAPLDYIEVRPIAHYLSGHGTSVAGVLTSTSSFLSFPDVADNHIATSSGVGDAVPPGSFININLPAGAFEFLYKSEGKTYTSNNFTGNGFDNGNSGALDHMVSWYTGTGVDLHGRQADVYLIAFERQHIDDDFQDGVYELRIARAVPEPSAYIAFTLGVVLLGWTSLKRRGNL